MKELAGSFAQLAAIIMILITLAVSTAAVAEWVTPGTAAAGSTSGVLQSRPMLAAQ
ncbi:MAG TPA: hypothetical protein VGB73_19980 [Pyrinomonadaceae bacterium]|jgi:hypothetical protein